MPTGLDGNPDPVVTTQRSTVLARVARAILDQPDDRVLVGIDGRSGTGKSTFGDELARTLAGSGVEVIRSTTDLFHRPRQERLRQGASSARGYYEDSHQVSVIVDELLVPFRDGADHVLVGAFDEPTDQPRHLTAAVPEKAVLVFDGLFVRRPELADHWQVTVDLWAQRRSDESWLAYLESDLPTDPIARATELDRRLERARWPRYRHGWQHYLEEGHPAPATFEVDNDDIAAPVITGGTAMGSEGSA